MSSKPGEEHFEFECPTYHVDMDIFDMPFPGDVIEDCPVCNGRHVYSTNIGTAWRENANGSLDCIDDEWSQRVRCK